MGEFSGKGDKKEKQQKEKKPAPEKQPAENKQKKAKPKEDYFDIYLAPAEPKQKDPFADMPKGTFDLEEWKRFYSNNDEDESVKWFWEHFDHENYSIWRGDYKYNDELTMVFMSCNLIGGMFQRLEKLKKNAFASCCLFGENNNSSISGIWVFKGQSLAFELSEDWQVDYASYDWNKLDSKSEECKALVQQYWKWEGEDKSGKSSTRARFSSKALVAV